MKKEVKLWGFQKSFFLKLGIGKGVVLILIAIFSNNAAAQHCPFDGGHMVVVHLTDGRGKTATSPSQKLTLIEINNPVAKSCEHAEGLLARKFLPTKEEITAHYERFWDGWLKDYKDWNFLGDGYYAVILNQAENDCMIKKGSDYEYRTREFEVKLDGFGTLPNVKVKKRRHLQSLHQRRQLEANQADRDQDSENYQNKKSGLIK